MKKYCRERLDGFSARRGAVLVLAAFLMIPVFAFVAFTVDVGYISLVKGQLQTSADAASLAAAWELLYQRRLQGSSGLNATEISARAEATRYAALNKAGWVALELDANTANATGGDIVFGKLSETGDVVAVGEAVYYNAVYVQVARTAEKNGSLPLFSRLCSVTVRPT